jgi:hypothetical protein
MASSREREDADDGGRTQGLGAESYLYDTSQAPSPEHASQRGKIHARSRRQLWFPG